MKPASKVISDSAAKAVAVSSPPSFNDLLSKPKLSDALPVVEVDTVYKRYQTVSAAVVAHPNRVPVSYDIVGNPFGGNFVEVVPYHPPSDEWPFGAMTVLREFHVGGNAVKYTFPCGAHEPEKHGSLDSNGLLTAAVAELAEEARLQPHKDYEPVELTPPDAQGTGLLEVKWARGHCHPFLVINPEPVPPPLPPRDEEELIAVDIMSIPDMRESMLSGHWLGHSFMSASLAMAHIRKLDLHKEHPDSMPLI